MIKERLFIIDGEGNREPYDRDKLDPYPYEDAA